MKKWLLFSVLLTALFAWRPTGDETSLADFQWIDAGAAWDNANATRAWIHTNTTAPVRVELRLYAEPVSNSLYIWNDSRSPFFAEFTARLIPLLASENISVHPFGHKSDGRLGILLIPEPFPLEALKKIPSLLDSGWTIFYAGAPFNTSGLGFSFQVQDALKHDILFESHNGTASEKSGWQVLRIRSGHFAYRSKPLELEGSTPQDTAERFARFLATRGWSTPLSEKKWNTAGDVLLWSTPFLESSAHAEVRVQVQNRTRRYFFEVVRPTFRAYAPSPVVFPDRGEFSFFNASETVRLLAEDPKARFLASLDPGQLRQGASFPTDNLSAGEYRLVVENVDGRFLSAAYLRVDRITVSIRHFDPATRTLYLGIMLGQTAAAYRRITWNNQTYFSDSEGTVRFRDVKPGFHRFDVEGFPATLTVPNPDPLSSATSLSLLAPLPILLMAWWVAKTRGKTFVRFQTPKRRARKTLILSPELIRSVFGKDKLAIPEISAKISRGDPHLHLYEPTLREALDTLASRGWLKKKGDRYCVGRSG